MYWITMLKLGDGYGRYTQKTIRPDYQKVIRSILFSCGGSTRTNDLQVMSLASYQLLHSAMLLRFCECFFAWSKNERQWKTGSWSLLRFCECFFAWSKKWTSVKNWVMVAFAILRVLLRTKQKMSVSENWVMVASAILRVLLRTKQKMSFSENWVMVASAILRVQR